MLAEQTMQKQAVRVFALALVLLVGCSDEGPGTGQDSGPVPGTERGPCYGNGTCNSGLTCASGVCVRLPDGAPLGPDLGLDSRPLDAAIPDAALPDALPLDTAILDAALPDAPPLDAVIPDAALPDLPAPDLLIPDQYIPDQYVPDQYIPDQYVPDQYVPDQYVPDQYVPDQYVPDQYVPDQMMPDQTPPDGGCPGTLERINGVCRLCDLWVPKDHSTIAKAIAAAATNTNICVSPGTYTGTVTLKPGVNLYGSGPTSKIVGQISAYKLAVAAILDTVVSGFTVQSFNRGINFCTSGTSGCKGIIHTNKNFRLSLERLHMNAANGGTSYCAELEFYNGGNITLDFVDSVCQSDRGLRIRMDTGAAKMEAEVTIARNRFEPTGSHGVTSIYDPVEALVNGSGSTPNALGTRINWRIENNEFYKTIYEGIYVVQGLVLQAADQPHSKILVINNTFIPSDVKNAIWNNSLSNRYPALVVVNNLYYYCTPLRGQPPVVNLANMMTTTASDFINLSKGDLRLHMSSPAIEAGNAAYAPKEDIAGKPRPIDGNLDKKADPDVGAHEYDPAAP